MSEPHISASPDDVRPNRRREPARQSSSGGGWFTNLMLVILVAGLVLAGWFIINQQELLKAAEADRDAADKRLQVLEDRLRATDEVMVDAGEDTKEKLGFWENEIRKLWDIAHRDNRKWIKENQAALASLQKTVGGLRQSSQQLVGKLDAQSESIAEQAASLDRLAELDAISKRLEQLGSAQGELRQTVAQLAANDSLSQRVVRNEQAVAAIDAYRVQLNSRLNDLQARVDGLRRELESQAAAPAGQ
ncbi:MAG: hypothetical protein AAF515_13155 [Pseudomonadota bacterium]